MACQWNPFAGAGHISAMTIGQLNRVSGRVIARVSRALDGAVGALGGPKGV
jgi:hypothetical protein